MYKLFGIPNCDTVKKARAFLDKQGVGVNFIDFKKSPPTEADLKRWSEAFGDFPVNPKGATYKKHKDAYEALSPKEKNAFLRENTSMLKRPILEKDGEVLAFGFDEESYKSVLK